MKVGAKTLNAILGVVTAQGLNEHKTITMTPGTNALTLTAANGTGSARAKILAITDEEEAIDACAVPSQTLLALAANSSADVIEISKPNGKAANTLAARAGASATSLTTREPTDFPPLDPAKPPSERTTFSLPLAMLTAGIHRVQFAAAKAGQNANLALTMTEFEITADGTLRTAATNGHVLSYAETPIPSWTGEPIKLLVPQTKALKHLLDLAGPDAKAHVMVANQKILIAVRTEAADVEVVLNTADLAYPDWQAIRSNSKPTLIAVAPLKAMRELMARANAICPTSYVGLKLSGKRLTLGAKNETTQHVDSMELDTLAAPGADGKPVPFEGEFTIHAAPQQIADTLAAAADWTNATHIRLGFSQPTKPIVINAVGLTYSNWLMPMAVGNAANSKPAEPKTA